MSHPDEAVIDRFYAGLASGDLDEALACMTPDACVWHSFDGIAQDRAASLESWRGLIANFAERSFVDVRRHRIRGGFVQQQMMTVRTTQGAVLGWATCVIVWLQDGLIARIDEYIDRAGRFDLMTLEGVTPGL